MKFLNAVRRNAATGITDIGAIIDLKFGFWDSWISLSVQRRHFMFSSDPAIHSTSGLHSDLVSYENATESLEVRIRGDQSL